MRYFLLSLITSLSLLSSASEFKAELKTENPTPKINDGEAYVVTAGGTAPFTYQWSKQSTSMESSNCSGLTEGSSFTVIVTDSEGNQQELTGTVGITSIEESINATFKPVVNVMTNILF